MKHLPSIKYWTPFPSLILQLTYLRLHNRPHQDLVSPTTPPPMYGGRGLKIISKNIRIKFESIISSGAFFSVSSVCFLCLSFWSKQNPKTRNKTAYRNIFFWRFTDRISNNPRGLNLLHYDDEQNVSHSKYS